MNKAALTEARNLLRSAQGVALVGGDGETIATATKDASFAAGVFSAFAQFEDREAAEKTADALAAMLVKVEVAA